MKLNDVLTRVLPVVVDLLKRSPAAGYLGSIGLVLLGLYQLIEGSAPEAAVRNLLIGLGLLGVLPTPVVPEKPVPAPVEIPK